MLTSIRIPTLIVSKHHHPRVILRSLWDIIRLPRHLPRSPHPPHNALRRARYRRIEHDKVVWTRWIRRWVGIRCRGGCTERGGEEPKEEGEGVDHESSEHVRRRHEKSINTRSTLWSMLWRCKIVKKGNEWLGEWMLAVYSRAGENMSASWNLNETWQTLRKANTVLVAYI